MDQETSARHTFTLDDLHMAIDLLATVIKKKEFIVAGSQAILATIAKTGKNSEELCQSHDLDIFSDPEFSQDERKELVKLAGPQSKFNTENDWVIEPIGPWVMMTSLPDWVDRLIPIKTKNRNQAFCISPLDIVFNKAEAGREKDIKFISQVFKAKLLNPSDLVMAMERYKKNFYPSQAEKVNATVQKAIQLGIAKTPKAKKPKVQEYPEM